MFFLEPWENAVEPVTTLHSWVGLAGWDSGSRGEEWVLAEWGNRIQVATDLEMGANMKHGHYSSYQFISIYVPFSNPTPQHFSKILENSVKQLYSTLKNPSLPLYECEELLSALSGRIPGPVEVDIHSLLNHYNNHLNSIVAQFPGQAIASVLDTHAAKIENKQERDAFYMQTQVIMNDEYSITINTGFFTIVLIM